MAIKLMDILETAGDFPVMEAPSIGVSGGKRLNELIDDNGKIKAEALPEIDSSDPRVDELIAMGEQMVGEISSLKAKDTTLSGQISTLDGQVATVTSKFGTDGKIKSDCLPEIVDDLVDDVGDINTVLGNMAAMFDNEGRLLPSILPKEKKPASINLTNYASNGTIVEQYADGSTFTYTVTFNADGKPVKVTDSDGNVTTMTW